MEELQEIRFSAADAARRNGEHAEREYHAYRRFTTACKARLQRFITEHPEQTFLVYAVPMVIVGASLKDAKGAINHIIHDLKKEGFDAYYLGENLIFIQWKPAPRGQYEVKDYVEGALAPRRSRQVVPPTQQSLQAHGQLSHRSQRGPGAPIIASDSERYKLRLERELHDRMQSYERDSRHPSAQRRKVFDGVMTHEDAMRAAVSRTTL
jgi:hypothetical protein